MTLLPLHRFRIGQCGTICTVAGEDAVVQRLLEMGVLEGETVELVAIAPLGDPMEFRLRDYRLSLRRSEAAQVTANLLTEGLNNF